MFRQKKETINTYGGAHFLVKLRAVGMGIFQFSYDFNVNKNENISFSGITRSVEAAT